MSEEKLMEEEEIIDPGEPSQPHAASEDREIDVTTTSPPPTPSLPKRPRRAAKKSVLYNAADYELQMPKEEPSEAVVKPRGARKRKQAPHLEEMETVYGDEMMVGAETVIGEEQEDGPPVLNMTRGYDDVLTAQDDDGDNMTGFVEDDDFLSGAPPSLEVNLPLSKRRGRPKQPSKQRGERPAPSSQMEEIIDVGDAKDLKKPVVKPAASRAFRIAGDRVISKTLADRQYHVKLFEDEVEMTEQGDCYATVISGCLAYLLRKERVIELLTNDAEVAMIREGGWLLAKPPRLPPLVQHKACFAFYVDGTKLNHIKDVSQDDLKPWSSTGEHFGDPVIKPNVRRHPVARVNGRLQPVKGDPRLAELHLTEYSAWLPRLLRLRKKIFYLSRDGQIYGNILILYDYTCPGEAPNVVNLPHGNDYLRTAMMESQADPNMNLDQEDVSTPFEDDIITGPRGGSFLRVKPTKLGWAHNKKLLLRYLINEPSLIDDSPCLNRRVPFLPPLVSTVGVFVYFVPANFIANQIHHTGDGLSPWTVNPNPGEAPSPRVRSTRRPMMQDENGQFMMCRDTGWTQTSICLVETMSVLARCPRLRKRVIYIQRNNSIIVGNVCYIYEYVREGPIPGPVDKAMHGNTTAARIAKRIAEMDWNDQKKNLNASLTSGPSTSSATAQIAEDDQFIDVEDLEVVEEEVITDGALMHMPTETIIEEEELVEMNQEDVLNEGYDLEFDDDPLATQENPAPYYETPRQLDTGHIYLTVRHKRVASTFDAVLEWICNTNVVEERGLLNYAKPGHPPIVRNARSYAFFVAGSAIFPHDINRDDFSPWSHNGNAQNPTCYRTKVRKIGVICDEQAGSQFQIKDVDYKTCPFHLVFLYSINPREPRLRKKIYYMMETESRLVVSHALILYDYNQEGELPRMHGGYLKRFAKRTGKRPPLQIHDVDNDVSDMSESEKEPPFVLPPQIAEDGCTYLQVLDMDFWNDRNRQLHYLVNKPSLVESYGCLNPRVPSMPPRCTGKAVYLFFVDGLEVDARNLTCDSLVPWSENGSNNPHQPTRRPKSSKTPLALNRDQQLRVWKTPAHRGDIIEFQLHTYTATLPRMPRLRKKVTYVLKSGQQIGHAMIIYWFTEPGEMPTPINVNALSNQEYSLQRLSPAIREEIHQLMTRLTPVEVAKVIHETHGITVNPKTLYYIRRREIMAMSDRGDPYGEMKGELIDQNQYVEEWTHPLDPGAKLMIDERDMQVAHTEEIEQPASSYPEEKKERPFHNKPVAPGAVRGSQRNDALWRIAKNSFGASNDQETFDLLFKMLFEKNESRLLHVVNTTFGVDIIPGDELMAPEEFMEHHPGIVEEIVEEEVVQQADLAEKDIEQVIVEEEVHDQLLDGVIVDEQVLPPN